MTPHHRTRPIALLLAVVLLGAACGGGGDGSGGGGDHVAVAGQAQTLKGNELRYGASATRSSAITYQPGVVLLGGGADSVRSVSSDGLVWTIDGKADGADRLKQGDVLFATSLGAGRVLAIDDDGPNKRVALGPIAMTDLIKDGSIKSDQPVNLQNALAYNTRDAPGQIEPTSATTSAASMLVGPPVRLTSARRDAPSSSMGAPEYKVGHAKAGQWKTISICCTSNGLHVGYDNNGAVVQATGELTFTQPSVSFDLVIDNGSLTEASAKLNGAATLALAFSASVKGSENDFRSGRVAVPISLNIPIPIGGIPFNVGFQQLFEVNLGLSGAAALSTEGEYQIGGSLGFGYKDGKPQAYVPTLKTVKSALDNIRSVAVAPQGLTLGWALKTTIGIGISSLSAGIWYKLSTALVIATSGSQIDPLQGTSLVSCETVSLRVFGSFGVGYTIPAFVAKAINAFLDAVMKNPPAPVQPVGGKGWGPYALFAKDTPPCSNHRPSQK
jgi:hypothetical protein